MALSSIKLSVGCKKVSLATMIGAQLHEPQFFPQRDELGGNDSCLAKVYDGLSDQTVA